MSGKRGTKRTKSGNAKTAQDAPNVDPLPVDNRVVDQGAVLLEQQANVIEPVPPHIEVAGALINLTPTPPTQVYDLEMGDIEPFLNMNTEEMNQMDIALHQSQHEFNQSQFPQILPPLPSAPAPPLEGFSTPPKPTGNALVFVQQAEQRLLDAPVKPRRSRYRKVLKNLGTRDSIKNYITALMLQSLDYSRDCEVMLGLLRCLRAYFGNHKNSREFTELFMDLEFHTREVECQHFDNQLGATSVTAIQVDED